MSRLEIALLCSLMLGVCAHEQRGVSVTVTESSARGRTTYSYRVHNSTAKPIVAFRIGYDQARGEAQLTTPPIGWSVRDGLRAQSAAAPEGWVVRLVTTEESDRFTVEWSSDRGSTWDIPPHGTRGGFRIILSKPSPQHRSPLFDVTLSDSTHRHGSVRPAKRN